MKIRLIEPSRRIRAGELLKPNLLLVPSPTLPLIASLTPPEIEIAITNELFQEIDFEEDVDLVGITAYSTNVHRAYEIADEFRKRDIPVAMGGIHVSMEPEEARGHADTVFIGEAEETWPQFINDVSHGAAKDFYRSSAPPPLTNRRPLHFPKQIESHYIGHQRTWPRLLLKPIYPIETSRGCPFDCDHCLTPVFFGKGVRFRPVVDVVAEIKDLGARICFFVDDNIFASPQRARELFKALAPLKITWFGQATIGAGEDMDLLRLARQSGCRELCIGLESLSHASLNWVQKKANRIEYYEKNLANFRKAGICIAASMMFGFDGEGNDNFKTTRDFLVKNKLPMTYWWPLTPLPGTRLYQRLLQEKRLKEEKWWLNPESVNQFLKYTLVDRDEQEFIDLFYRYYRHFYSWPSMARRLLVPPHARLLTGLFLNLVARKKLRKKDHFSELLLNFLNINPKDKSA